MKEDPKVIAGLEVSEIDWGVMLESDWSNICWWHQQLDNRRSSFFATGKEGIAKSRGERMESLC